MEKIKNFFMWLYNFDGIEVLVVIITMMVVVSVAAVMQIAGCVG